MYTPEDFSTLWYGIKIIVKGTIAFIIIRFLVKEYFLILGGEIWKYLNQLLV